MDILYILGKGSPFGNEELRYSLRSLETNGTNIGNLFLVGEKPAFLDYSKVTHLPFIEKGVKDYRIASKIMHACQSGLIGEDFIFCNDDFFFMNSFDAAKFPYYQKGALLKGKAVRAYQEHLEITRDYLISQGKKALHYDVHCPIIYNCEKFMSLAPTWEYSGTTIGLTVKSIYANMNDIFGVDYEDVKLKQLIDPIDYYFARLNECFSISDSAWKHGVESFLQKEFPTKSKWEL